jgi:hypothetical protein
MIERLDDMPAGVIGIRASGKLTKDDYRDGLEPALKEATDSGEARVLFVPGSRRNALALRVGLRPLDASLSRLAALPELLLAALDRRHAVEELRDGRWDHNRCGGGRIDQLPMEDVEDRVVGVGIEVAGVR